MSDSKQDARTVAAAERAAVAALSRDSLLELLFELIAVPSLAAPAAGRRAGEGESLAQRVVESKAREIGLAVDRWPIDLDALREHPAYSSEIEREEAFGLVAFLGDRGASAGSRSRTLVLNGHVDVVPAGALDRWTSPPFEPVVRGGEVCGRGALDMKGGLACALIALEAIARAGVELAGAVLLQSVVGEEDGGLGTLATIERGHLGDAAIVLEPTGLEIVCAQAGCANFRLTVRGRSAHGCHRDEGVSAIEKFALVHRGLLELEARYNEEHRHPLLRHLLKPYPLSVGTVRAGDWPSTVPDLLVAEGRFGVALGSNLVEARGRFEAALEAINESDPWLRSHPARVEWWGGQFEPGETAVEEEIVRVLSSASRETTGRRPRCLGVPYGADLRLLIHQGGMPSVLFGPGDVRRAHAPNESVPIAELETTAVALVRTILRFVGIR